MRVFVAGASGAIGTRLVPQLIQRGHEVIGTSRSNADRIAALGAEAIALDLLDPHAVRKAVLETKPDAIVHQATALADVQFSRNLDRSFAQTNRLRREGTDALLAAAREAGVTRFVAQSFANFRYAREGGPVKTEDDPLDPTPVSTMRETSAAMTYLDQAVMAAGGIALRYGSFYGAPTTGWSSRAQAAVPDRRRGRRRLFVRPPRRRRRSDRARARTRRPGDLQHRRQRARAGARLAAGAGEGTRSQAAPPLPGLARAPVAAKPSHAGNRGPRCLEREGQARARLDLRYPTWRQGFVEAYATPAASRSERRSPAPAKALAAVLRRRLTSRRHA